MIGTTRSRVSFFMNRFRKLGYIEYNGRIRFTPRCSTWFCTIRCPRRTLKDPNCSTIFQQGTKRQTSPVGLSSRLRHLLPEIGRATAKSLSKEISCHLDSILPGSQS